MENKLTLKINDFEGPLDVLLYLVRKHKMEISDIPILEIIEQYFAFLESLALPDWELASEFVEMASRLLHMKSVMLLPKYEEEQEQLKEELQGQLIQYQLIQEIVELLKEQTGGFLRHTKPEQEVEVDETYRFVHDKNVLKQAIFSVQGKARKRAPLQEKVFEKIVAATFVPVSSRMVYILERFRKEKKLDPQSLFAKVDKSTSVATFLAILEMVKKKAYLF